MAHDINWEDAARELGYIIYRMYDGDVVESAPTTLRELGFTDNFGEWIYEDE